MLSDTVEPVPFKIGISLQKFLWLFSNKPCAILLALNVVLFYLPRRNARWYCDRVLCLTSTKIPDYGELHGLQNNAQLVFRVQTIRGHILIFSDIVHGITSLALRRACMILSWNWCRFNLWMWHICSLQYNAFIGKLILFRSRSSLDWYILISSLVAAYHRNHLLGVMWISSHALPFRWIQTDTGWWSDKLSSLWII
jgi:hypothetical protein